MNIELLLGLVGFACATLFVPGPNNLLLMGSGAAFGFRRCIPHVLGAVLGFNLLIAIAAIGLGGIVLKYPGVTDLLRIGGALYLVFLGGQSIYAALLQHSPDRTLAKRAPRPFNTVEAMLFQGVNPSALILAVATVSAFATLADSLLARWAILASIFSIVALFATSTWAGMGASLSALFAAPTSGRLLRIAMGGLIILTAIFVF